MSKYVKVTTASAAFGPATVASSTPELMTVEELNNLREQNEVFRAALEYVARHKEERSGLSQVILEECGTVAEQALAKWPKGKT